MSDTVVSLDTAEPGNAEQRVESFLMRNRIAILAGLAVLVLAAVVVCVVVGVSESQRKNGLSRVDAIEYAYTRNAGDLAEEEVAARQNTALEALKPYMGKKGVVGLRANLLAADIEFSRTDYAAARDLYLAAAGANKKDYNVALCYYNAAVCSEELESLADAAAYYGQAADVEGFVLVTRALFNLGRVREASGDFAGASAAYQRLVDSYSGDDWTNLAQSRLIALKVAGKL